MVTCDDDAVLGVAVVTGASRGIGAETARQLADRGYDIVVGFARDRDAAQRVVLECMELGRRAVAVGGDVSDEATVDALFSAADDLGPARVLVNNAGIVAPRARVDEVDRDRLVSLFGVNVVGPFLCAREAVRRMSTRHGGAGGAIVNVSSIAARLGSPGEYVDYAASKAALDTMTIGLAREVAAEGVRVNCVRPGLVDTDIHASGGQPDRLERIAPTVPMQRAGRPDEVASAIVWLCSDDASYITGSLLDIGGGR
jgi:NAD(P)-dependent dehydrogenase (short-subunit alcohol dehydrogenase family)